MKDQYENEIPGDLVLLPDLEWAAESNLEEVELVIKARWYEVNGYALCASAEEIEHLSDATFEDATGETVVSIDYMVDCLHRYSPEDGFYHA